jgi:hypothetical protein
MSQSAIHRLLIAFANPAANSGIHTFRHNVASVLREVLRLPIHACFIIYESAHHP